MTRGFRYPGVTPGARYGKSPDRESNRGAETWAGEGRGFRRGDAGALPRGSAIRRKVLGLRHRVAGKPKKLTLGAYPLLGLAEARTAARAAAQAVALGKDPAGDKRQAREDAPKLTVRAQADTYHRRHLSKLRSGEDARRVLERSAVAAWGDRAVASITKRDVVALLDKVEAERGPQAANMALARVRSFMAWLADRDVISASPAAGVRMPAASTARDRVLTDDELRLVWQAAGGLSEPFGAFVRLLILTGQRRDEVARMTADELAGDVWTIPGSRAKNGEAHAVPLSPETLAVLAEVKRIGPGRYVFTTNGTAPVSGYSKAKAALDAAVAKLAEKEGREPPPGWTLHDLRRTCATGLARLGVRVEVTETVLNHKSGTRAGIVGVYQRHDFAAEKRAALDAWGRHVLGLTAGKRPTDNVVRLEATR